MNLRLLLLLALSVVNTAAHADALPDYIRYAEDAQSTRLELAIKTFALPAGQRVDLIGVVHIADAAYYQELNRRFATYDSVLFELVGDPRALTGSADSNSQRSDSAIGFLQKAAGQYLELTFQLDGIDYTRKNMVHADTSLQEFRKMQLARGETMSTLFARAMQAQMTEQAKGGSASELDMLGLIRILMSPDSAAAFKKALAKMFDQMESVSATMEGTDGTAALSGRNEVAVKKLTEVLADRKQRRVAVFYGAAHMPGIQAALISGMKAKPAGEEWLPAWTIPK